MYVRARERDREKSIFIKREKQRKDKKRDKRGI
jgi:hypothetical protein